jgi:simple sugar transport system ATP-binding protein
MTGRDIEEEAFVYEQKDSAKTVLEVRNLSLKDGYKDCSFSIKAGEILGITGLLGSGRTELAETIFGVHKADSGQIILDGKEVQFKNVQDAMANGIGYVPPERNVMGLFMDQSISDNISVTRWADCRKGPMMDQNSVDSLVDHWVKELSIKIGSAADTMRTLSGGNAQKCVLAKWLALDLKVLILNGPTVGVDIGAKYDIYNLTKKLAESGLAVIIISDDIREVLLNCNRVLIMRRGHLVDEKMTKDLDEETLSKLSVEY